VCVCVEEREMQRESVKVKLSVFQRNEKSKEEE
jgi:hypothetical protein